MQHLSHRKTPLDILFSGNSQEIQDNLQLLYDYIRFCSPPLLEKWNHKKNNHYHTGRLLSRYDISIIAVAILAGILSDTEEITLYGSLLPRKACKFCDSGSFLDYQIRKDQLENYILTMKRYLYHMWIRENRQMRLQEAGIPLINPNHSGKTTTAVHGKRNIWALFAGMISVLHFMIKKARTVLEGPQKHQESHKKVPAKIKVGPGPDFGIRKNIFNQDGTRENRERHSRRRNTKESVKGKIFMNTHFLVLDSASLLQNYFFQTINAPNDFHSKKRGDSQRNADDGQPDA